MATNVELPAYGEPVVLYPSADERLVSRIEDAARDTLVCTPPNKLGKEVDVAEGTSLVAEWVTARGLVRAPGRASIDRSGPKALLVSLIGEPELFQRREFVRAKSALRVELTLRGTKVAVEGMTIDVSGGGLRVQAMATKLPVGANVEVWLDVPDGPIEAEAMVLRHQGMMAVVLRFTEIDENERQRLVRHVFDQLRASARNW
jgi:hypothetical protein